MHFLNNSINRNKYNLGKLYFIVLYLINLISKL
jgi:hypothetical protein